MSYDPPIPFAQMPNHGKMSEQEDRMQLQEIPMQIQEIQQTIQDGQQRLLHMETLLEIMCIVILEDRGYSATEILTYMKYGKPISRRGTRRMNQPSKRGVFGINYDDLWNL